MQHYDLKEAIQPPRPSKKKKHPENGTHENSGKKHFIHNTKAKTEGITLLQIETITGARESDRETQRNTDGDQTTTLYNPACS